MAKVTVLDVPKLRRERGGQVVFSRKQAKVIGYFNEKAKVILHETAIQEQLK